MSYSIVTKDGITINGIPDNIPEDAPELKARVAKERALRDNPPPTPMKPDDVGSPVEGNSFGKNAIIGVGKAMTDMALAAKQATAAVTRDKPWQEALNKEAEEKARLDSTLMETGGGMVGKYGTDMASAFLPMGAVAKGVAAVPKFLPTGTKFLGAASRALAPSVATGAAQGVLTPDAEYTLGGQAGEGAVVGAAGEVVGRGLGRLVKPFRNMVSPKADAGEVLLKGQDILRKPTAINMTDNESIKAASDALSKIPWISKDLIEAQGQNLKGLTKYQTKRAGVATEDVGDLFKIKGALDNEMAAFRAGPNIPTQNIPNDLLPLHNALSVDRTFGLGSPKLLDSTGKVMQATSGVSNVPVDTAIDLYQQASKMARGAGTYAERRQAQELRDIYGKHLESQYGKQFESWNRKWGAFKDTERAVEASGATRSGQLKPSSLLSATERTAAARPGSHENILSVAADRMPTPPGQENRSLMTALLLGGGGAAAGGLGGVMSGQNDMGDILRSALVGAGTTAGAGKIAGKLLGTEGGGKYLTGKFKLQDDEKIKLLRKLLASGVIAGGVE